MQLATGPASEITCIERLKIRIYLCRHVIYLIICAWRGGTFVLTRFDIGEMAPRPIIIVNKFMYLFHTYRICENHDFDDFQTYRYSCPEVRMMSYRSSAINRR